MNIIKKTALTFFMAVSLGASSTLAFAEDAVNASAGSITETITHVEKALVDVNNSDFSSARLHFKAARAAAEKITGHDETVKKATDILIQGQIQSNQGNVKASADDLTKALELYKSL